MQTQVNLVSFGRTIWQCSATLTLAGSEMLEQEFTAGAVGNIVFLPPHVPSSFADRRGADKAIPVVHAWG